MTHKLSDNIADDLHPDFNIEQVFTNKSELLMFRAMSKLSEKKPMRVFCTKSGTTAVSSTLKVAQSDVSIQSEKGEILQKYRTIFFKGPLFSVNIADLKNQLDGKDHFIGSWNEFLSTVIEDKPLNLYRTTVTSVGDDEKGVDDEPVFELPPLPALDDPNLRDIVSGPTPYSNWVVPGSVLVGAWIGSDYDSAKDAHMKAVLKAGVSVFVSLVAETEQTYMEETRKHFRELMNSSTTRSEPNSPKQQYIKPTRAHIRAISKEDNGKSDDDSDLDEVDRQLSFIRFPINDYSRAPNTLQFQQFLNELISLMLQGKKMYIHCRGGHGRTGMAAAYLLGALYDISVDEALRRTQEYHDLRQYSNRLKIDQKIKSPETEGQFEQVRSMLADVDKTASLSVSSVSSSSTPKP